MNRHGVPSPCPICTHSLEHFLLSYQDSSHSHMEVTSDFLSGQSVPPSLCKLWDLSKCLYTMSTVFTCFPDLNTALIFQETLESLLESEHKNSPPWPHHLIPAYTLWYHLSHFFCASWKCYFILKKILLNTDLNVSLVIKNILKYNFNVICDILPYHLYY